MSIIKSMVIAFSMYSKIPMPHLELDEKDMKYVMGFFPLIGLITGTLVYGWIYAGEILYVPDISRTLVLIILPVIITGGIHVDGYMDTCDALNSYGDREKKLAILKDSHIGAFAVIKLLVYYVLYFAAAFIVVQKAGNMQDFLKSRYPDYTIELTKTVDADLLGGYVIRAHHKEYDRSFEGRFCQLERKLTGR